MTYTFSARAPLPFGAWLRSKISAAEPLARLAAEWVTVARAQGINPSAAASSVVVSNELRAQGWDALVDIAMPEAVDLYELETNR